MNIANKQLKINNIPGPEGVRGRCSDNSLIYSDLSWKPKTNLIYGIEHLYKWINTQVENYKAIQTI